MDLKTMQKTFVTMEELDGYILKMYDYVNDYHNCSMFLLMTPNGRKITTIQRESFIVEEINGKEVKRKTQLDVTINSLRQRLNV